MVDLTTIFHHLQRQLFPELAAGRGTLSALDQRFRKGISLTDQGRFTRRYDGAVTVRRPARASGWHTYCEACHQFPTASGLLDALKSHGLLRELCGWDSAG